LVKYLLIINFFPASWMTGGFPLILIFNEV
jgi:hypothetical protein